MRFASPYPPERRGEAEALLRGTDLTMVEIGARLGVKVATVRTWKRRSWRLPRLSRKTLSAWPVARREALARLHGEPGVDPDDLAIALGIQREAAAALFAAFGLPAGPAADRMPAPAVSLDTALDAAAAADAPTLRAHLRAHIARQIAAFDAALKGEGAAVVDSARVLRDLGGLKRLFDELVLEEPAGENGDGPEPDLPALRAAIARRYARFVGEPAAA